MALTAMQNYENENDDNKKAVRTMVLQAIDQIKQGQTRDFSEVCERLEQKYTRA